MSTPSPIVCNLFSTMASAIFSNGSHHRMHLSQTTAMHLRHTSRGLVLLGFLSTMLEQCLQVHVSISSVVLPGTGMPPIAAICGAMLSGMPGELEWSITR